MQFEMLKKPTLISTQKIWDKASHNAFTDLIFFNGTWFCTFREAESHGRGSNGKIRLLHSVDLSNWNSLALFEQEGVDLRDPKLSETADGQLMLLVGGSIYTKRKKHLSFQSRAAFSKDGIHWTPFQLILEEHEWLWRVTWHEGKAYGASYRFSNPKRKKSEWKIALWVSENGIDYRMVTQWKIRGYPNETTLRFFPDNRMMALVKRDKQFSNEAWIGISDPPYENWNWVPSSHYFGGPNFIILQDQSVWGGGRILFLNPYGLFEKTVLAKIDPPHISPYLFLPSNGDCGYPGMVHQNDILWMSYYSSHEDKSAIYLSSIQINP